MVSSHVSLSYFFNIDIFGILSFRIKVALTAHPSSVPHPSSPGSGREFVRRLSVRKPGSSRPVPTQLVPSAEDRADPARAQRSSSSPARRSARRPANVISTVTETKQGVTPREKDAWARRKYFITLQRSGLPAGASRCLLRCGRRGSGRMLGWPTIADDAPTNEPNERISRADDRLRRAFRVSCACAPGAIGKIGSLSRSRERCSDELKQGIKHKKRQLKDGKWLACPA